MKENYNLKKQLDDEFIRIIDDIRDLKDMLPEATEDCYNDPFYRRHHSNDIENISRLIRIRTMDLFRRVAPTVMANPFNVYMDTESNILYMNDDENNEELINQYGFEAI